MDLQKEIIRITSEYFNDHLDYQKLSIASKEYKNLLNWICGQNMVENGRNVPFKYCREKDKWRNFIR